MIVLDLHRLFIAELPESVSQRTSYTQVYAGKQISYEQLQPGDLIFYTANGGPGAINHVAIYVGGGMMVHAASPELGIITSPVLYKQPAAYVSILG